MTTDDVLRIYVASLSDYNAGVLHGRWIVNLELYTAEEVLAGINEMLAESPTARSEGMPAEEWAVHDYEGFGRVVLSEHPNIEKLCYLASMLDRHGEAFALFWNAEGAEYATEEAFEESYCGQYDSFADYAEELVDEGCFDKIPEAIAPYIDYEKLGRDLSFDGYWLEDGHLFRPY